MNKLRPKPEDYLVMILLLLAGLAGLWNSLRLSAQVQTKYVAIYEDNRRVAELSLDGGSRYRYSFSFGAEKEYQAVLEIDGGRVRMLPLDEKLCPRGVCSHTGWIEHSYQSIVCLPNRLMVIFTSAPSENGENLDGITY